MELPSQTATGPLGRCPSCGIETVAGVCPRCQVDKRGATEIVVMTTAVVQRRRLVKRLALGLSIVGGLWFLVFGLPLVWAQLNRTELAIIGVLAIALFGPRLWTKVSSSRWWRRRV